jgi:hypothetical protein
MLDILLRIPCAMTLFCCLKALRNIDEFFIVNFLIFVGI